MSARPRSDARVSVVLVGCGAVSREYYAPALADLAARGWIESLRLFDPAPDAARRVAGRLPRSLVEASFDAVLEGPAELAIVASPPSRHAEQVGALLRHGKHVLCEKPFTLDADTAEALARAAREAQRVCAVGMVRRFSRVARTLQALLDADLPARPRRLTWQEGSVFRWPVGSTEYFTADPGSRLLWDIGSHVVDLVTWWLGRPARATCRDDAMGGVEANCSLELHYDDGPAVEIRLSRDSDLPGGLVVERAGDLLLCRDVCDGPLVRRTPDGAEAAVPGEGPDRFEDCFRAQLENVLASVRGAAEPWVPASSVVEGIRCLAACDAARTPLHLPWLSTRERERARALREAALPAPASAP